MTTSVQGWDDDEGWEDWYGEEKLQPAPYSSINDTNYWTAPEPDATGIAPHGFIGDVRCASWPRRLGALAVDWFLTVYLPPTVALWLLGIPEFALAALVVAISLQLQRAERSGQTVGKALLGIQVVRPVKYQGGQALVRVGAGRNLARMVLHLLDCLPFGLGLLRPIWDRYRRTWADSLTHCVVIHPEGGPEPLPKAPPGSHDLT